MKHRTLMAGALLAACALAAVAQENETKKPDMDPAMMQAMMAAGTPGEPHKKLDGMTGSWDVKVTMWMVPGAEPMISNGTSEQKWVMGGRYIEQRFQSDFGGMPYEGLGYQGYDNIKKRYWSTWMDNMSTSVMTSTGTSSDGKTWTFTGTSPDPMTGKDMTMEEKVTVVDADHHVMEMWSPGPDGKMYKSMELAFTRKKGSR